MSIDGIKQDLPQVVDLKDAVNRRDTIQEIAEYGNEPKIMSAEEWEQSVKDIEEYMNNPPKEKKSTLFGIIVRTTLLTIFLCLVLFLMYGSMVYPDFSHCKGNCNYGGVVVTS